MTVNRKNEELLHFALLAKKKKTPPLKEECMPLIFYYQGWTVLCIIHLTVIYVPKNLFNFFRMSKPSFEELLGLIIDNCTNTLSLSLSLHSAHSAHHQEILGSFPG